MSACNDCWDEAFKRAQRGGGHQAEHYETLLLLPPTERHWCAFAQRNGYAPPPAAVTEEAER
jgi:hypothetical protein